MMKSYALTAVLFLATVVSAQAPPAPAPVSQNWSVNTQALVLPGLGKTLSGLDAGVTFTPSANFDLFERNIVTTDTNLMYYAGGVRYRFPALSRAANNAATNTNFLRVRFFLQGSAGIVTAYSQPHYGYTAGGGFDYQLNQSGSWTTGATVEYGHFPGYNSRAVIVETGVKFHF